MNSREIIRQFVNMARHPKAKDLAEALEMEKLIDGCKILAKLKSASYVKNLYAPIEEQEYMEFIVNNSGLSTTGAYGTSLFDTDDSIELCNVVILGRPITAFDVCWALNKRDFRLRNFTANQIGIFYNTGNDGKDSCWIKFETIKQDGTHTTLDEWSDDTSDKITKLINL